MGQTEGLRVIDAFPSKAIASTPSAAQEKEIRAPSSLVFPKIVFPSTSRFVQEDCDVAIVDRGRANEKKMHNLVISPNFFPAKIVMAAKAYCFPVSVPGVKIGKGVTFPSSLEPSVILLWPIFSTSSILTTACIGMYVLVTSANSDFRFSSEGSTNRADFSPKRISSTSMKPNNPL